MNKAKKQWVVIFEEALFGTSGACAQIQKLGTIYRVTSGQKTWSYHQSLHDAATACAAYCNQYNFGRHDILKSCPFQVLGISK